MMRCMLAVLMVLLLSLHSGAVRAGDDLRWGADAQSDAPYIFHDPDREDRLIGYEKDIVDEIGRHLNRNLIFVQNGWDSLIPGLDRGLYDFSIDGLEITPAHREVVDFSKPYYVTSEQLVVRKDSKGLDTLESLHGHAVGTLKASVGERILQKHPDINLRVYEEEIDAYTDLHNGRTDAVLLDWPIALYYSATDPSLKLIGKPIGHLEYGIAVRKGNQVLLDQINTALDQMRADGTLRRILERWNLWTPAMETFTGDHTSITQPAVYYDEFVKAHAPATAWRIKFKRYIGFIPLIAHAAVTTLEVSLLAMVLAVAMGLLLAVSRLYGPAPLRMLSVMYIEIMRGTPLLIQVLFVFYGLPNLGIRLDPFFAGVLALGLNYAAYEAENYRAGLGAVPHGQYEAAIALNMTSFQALRHVVIPQAFRLVIPVMTNDFISALKDSSLLSVITLSELSQTYVRLSTTYYDYFGTGLMIGAAYLLIGLPFVRLARWTEERLHTGRRPQRRV
ncbi:ABC transporter substrate-binding protein/permease [Granulibacter bethesdensis]|uniref:Gln/Arg/Lys/His-binding protein and permease protein n=2 Tax=Granulibacter bethesdensis TaxID=364410 RepID=Q0BTS7_GRABC|nr:Gln/Arg/Lys/His-binding protein and permease protein [Granulibacter bethesdensis CGDNIH1]AHJ62701.1 Gln/Arg/Lys/His-binding protein and permease protein [Granulibacter bethesdensis]AHJ66735.1 Gln/Arg/Lys/His-binding protein and permease protein [Granulibacter bethesdensis CGDNIH4]AHJ69401.1 Gln/Arg/Lys/His-binding protein and permease protein [Granulibacter bethesdensis]APH51585.1 Gln/Arg/Lys/His-binding protein and permease protein [Granulibacter bethesdensis]